ERGGAVPCIESGWTMERIGQSAYRFQQRIESGERVVVGVNRYVTDDADRVEIMRISPQHQTEQAAALARLRARRDRSVVASRLAAIERAARRTNNLMPPLKAALAEYVTIGECCDVLRGVFGEYRPVQS